MTNPNPPQLARRIPRASAFTLVEILVVITIMTILISSVMIASTALLSRAKTSSTEAMLAVVNQAIEEFKREQTTNPTLTRNRFYKKRYGAYPPDELEVFTRLGVPGGSANTLAPSGATIQPVSDYAPMKHYSQGLSNEEKLFEYRDQKAMILAIQLFGDASSSILEGVQAKYWRDVPSDGNHVPLQFLDRNGNDKWDAGDLALRYLVDDWGNPISYFAQRDHTATVTPVPSTNHDDWNDASAELIRMNRGRPILVSYGPDGSDQLTEEAMGDDAVVSLVGDFEDGSPPGREAVNHPLNADNVYSSVSLKEALSRGIKD